MTTTVPNTFARQRLYTEPRQPFPYSAVLLLVIAAIILGIAARFSQPLAAVLFVPFYVCLCVLEPRVALWLMFFAVAFPYDVSGGGFVHSAPAEISLVVATPIFWLRTVARGGRRVINPILLPVLIYFLICVISTLVHWTGRDAIVSILQMVLYLVLAVKFFSTWIKNRAQLRAALYGLITACTLVSILLVGFRREDILGIHKNATGTFLSYTVIILAELWLAAATIGRRRGWLNLLLLVNLAGLVMSTSRGAWMGAIAGLCVLMLARRQYGLFAKAIVIMIPAIAICWFLVPQEQREYAIALGSSSRNVQARLITIENYREQFMKSPIIGQGVGLRKEQDSTNIVMSTLAETGVVGLVAFAAIQVVFFWTLFRAIRAVPRDHPDFSFLLLGGALVLCLFVHGCVDHYWSRTQIPVWGMAGAAIGVASDLRRRPRQAAPR
jgi:hypothetical protein